MLIKDPDSKPTSGQLIDALKAGKVLKREYYNDCYSYLTYRNYRLDCWGWGSALGEPKDRLTEIIDDPDKWTITTEEEAFPDRKKP